MSDLVSRQDVLGILKTLRNHNISAYEYDKWILGMPSAESERKTGKWILRSEQLPTAVCTVLTTRKDGDVWVEGFWPDEPQLFDEDIIAWMPLPEPYQEVKE